MNLCVGRSDCKKFDAKLVTFFSFVRMNISAVLCGILITYYVFGLSLGNVLCDTQDWATVAGESIFSSSDCSIRLTDETTSNAVWFGNENGHSYDSKYDTNSYIIESNFSVTSGYHSAGILFRATSITSDLSSANFYFWGISALNDYVGCWKFSDDATIEDTNGGTFIIAYPYQFNTTYSFKLVSINGVYNFSVNNELIWQNVSLPDYKIGTFGLFAYYDVTAKFDYVDFINLEPTIAPTTIPTVLPTMIPTQVPTLFPEQMPTQIPTNTPTMIPTIMPSNIPQIIGTSTNEQKTRVYLYIFYHFRIYLPNNCFRGYIFKNCY